MKILFVVTGLSMGGAENQVVNLADELHTRGHHVTIAYIVEPATVLPRSADVDIISLGGDKSLVGVLRAYKNLVKLIDSINPDIIHSHMYHANIISRLARVLVKIPKLICTSHSNNEGGSLRMLLYRVTNSLGDLFTGVSKRAVLEYEAKQAVPKGKMVVMYNGIDADRFKFSQKSREHIREELGLGEKKVFISVGRFHKAKDYPNLLRAYSMLLKEFNDVHLLIVGDGELREEIKRLIKELGIESFVTLLRVRRDIEDLLSASDLFVLSSAWEGFGLVVAEAMSCQRVVVATDCGGVLEVVGECGYLVEPENSYKLFESMRQAYLLDEKEFETKGKLARDRVLERYDLKSRVDKWEEIYGK